MLCFFFIKGQRLAVQKCEEYRKITSSPVQNCTKVERPVDEDNVVRNGEIPHHALLGYLKEDKEDEYEFKCGGTLISDQHVLTAAHCIQRTIPEVVRLGIHDSENESNDEVQVAIESVLMHPEYSARKAYHDIAILKLVQKVPLSRVIRPACLWDTEYRSFSLYISTGFETDYLSRKVGSVLMKLQLEELSVEECTIVDLSSRYFPDGLHDGQLCVRTYSCDEFSGEALMPENATKPCISYVVGIASRGTSCYNVVTSIYTKVSYYIDWIESNVWGQNATQTVQND
ncbi:serine protease snake-like [Anopheles coustani]|uniref:serine protease snake-like n=1 Tax=Anopheles coustani TaxID=139045 RepID=UPI00265B1164|nr:serine protease snake-like [Anopheles coustani]